MTIKITTVNAAFQDGNRDAELARILRELAKKFEEGGTPIGYLYDINGNKVGEVRGK